jgi:hypothetical protein
MESLRRHWPFDSRRESRLDSASGDHSGVCTSCPFEPFDREAQIRERDGKSLPALLQEFADLRLERRICR